MDPQFLKCPHWISRIYVQDEEKEVKTTGLFKIAVEYEKS